jgi:hypothetical protein
MRNITRCDYKSIPCLTFLTFLLKMIVYNRYVD